MSMRYKKEPADRFTRTVFPNDLLPPVTPYRLHLTSPDCMSRTYERLVLWLGDSPVELIIPGNDKA